jgi:hypothetical protein
VMAATPAQLAEKLGVSVSHFCKILYEQKATCATLGLADTLYCLVSALGTSVQCRSRTGHTTSDHRAMYDVRDCCGKSSFFFSFYVGVSVLSLPKVCLVSYTLDLVSSFGLQFGCLRSTYQVTLLIGLKQKSRYFCCRF